MRKNMTKSTAIAMLAGTLLQGGCINWDSWWGQLLYTGFIVSGIEWVTDNDAIFDLFEDGNVAAPA